MCAHVDSLILKRLKRNGYVSTVIVTKILQNRVIKTDLKFIIFVLNFFMKKNVVEFCIIQLQIEPSVIQQRITSYSSQKYKK